MNVSVAFVVVSHRPQRPPPATLFLRRIAVTLVESACVQVAGRLHLLLLTGEPVQEEKNMAHFTQLGISTNQEQKPQGKTLPKVPEGQRLQSGKKASGKQKAAFLVGSLIATALLGVFVLESGCSRESRNAAAIAPPSPVTGSQAPAQMQTIPPLTSTPAVAIQLSGKKKSRQRKLSASTYTDPVFGVSFQYPKNGSLMEADMANLEPNDLELPATNFVQPGGTTISIVELQRKLYAGTDFDSAFF